MTIGKPPGTRPDLRPVVPGDLPGLLELNDGAVPHVNRIGLPEMEWFAENAAYFRVAELERRLAGFLIALTPEADYGSLNFLWFRRHRPSFVYVDRIIVAPSARRRGIARRLYEDLEEAAAELAPLLACEVNLRPSNEGSMRFHERLGFVQVGRQETEGGAKEVALMEKALARH